MLMGWGRTSGQGMTNGQVVEWGCAANDFLQVMIKHRPSISQHLILLKADLWKTP